MTRLEELSYLQYLKDGCSYVDPRPLDDGRWSALLPLMFTWAIITGDMGNRMSYSDRWCYHDEDAARAAHEAWNGQGEPQGWHRHPMSGRRRDPDGEETIRY